MIRTIMKALKDLQRVLIELKRRGGQVVRSEDGYETSCRELIVTITDTRKPSKRRTKSKMPRVQLGIMQAAIERARQRRLKVGAIQQKPAPRPSNKARTIAKVITAIKARKAPLPRHRTPSSATISDAQAIAYLAADPLSLAAVTMAGRKVNAVSAAAPPLAATPAPSPVPPSAPPQSQAKPALPKAQRLEAKPLAELSDREGMARVRLPPGIKKVRRDS